MPTRKVLATAAALVTVGAALSLTDVHAPSAHATAPSAAYAVIGIINLGATPENLAIDANDDTVYVINYSGRRLLTVAPGTTSGTPVASVNVPGRPAGVAVDSDDDTVYVRNDVSTGGRSVWALFRGLQLDDTITTPGMATSLAVDSPDDTIYVTYGHTGTDDSLLSINGRNYDDSIESGGIGAETITSAVDQRDDTVWLTSNAQSALDMVNGATRAVTRAVGSYSVPVSLAVSSVAHAAYVSSQTTPFQSVTRVTPDGSTTPWTSPESGTLRGVSVDDSGTRVVLTVADDTLYFLNGTTMQQIAQPISPPGFASASRTAQATSGLIYVTDRNTSTLSVVARVQGGISGGSVQPGDAVNAYLTTTPEFAAGQQVDMASSTITDITFGGVSATYTKTGINVFTAQAPSGPTGQVEVVAQLAGGASISLGYVDYGSPAPPPRPIPIFPASAPRDVAATAGDASASVTWIAPEWPGTFPIIEYAVTATPGGRMCRTTAIACIVDGLDNGTTYTFTVKALTGAGWSPESAPSNAVTPLAPPSPSIVITGAREGRRMIIDGLTTGLLPGAQATPEFTRDGRTSILGRAVAIGSDGTFRWSRVANPRVGWTVAFTAADGTRSNTVRIDPR